MPSPFPGMDPFIEGQKWRDFHTTLITVVRELLLPQVRPRYVVDIQEDVYLVAGSEEVMGFIEPDVHVAREPLPTSGVATLPAVAAGPVVHHMSVPRRLRQQFLTIRDRSSRRVVTVLEVLSPTNKQPGAGRRKYLRKRSRVLAADASLVELDLLRGGRRLRTLESLTPADYYAFVSSWWRLPEVEVYPWSLRGALGTVLVPLDQREPAATLDVQAACTTSYDRAGYDYSLDYDADVHPALSDADREWVRATLRAVRERAPVS
jgi:hypothetical protein